MSINYKTILDLEQKSQISNADLLMVGNEGTGELKQIAWKDAVKDISVDLDGYAKTTDLPTKTSQLVNDSGFLTQHQNLSAYAKTENHYTKTESDAAYLTKDYAQKTYAQKTEIPAVPTKTSQLTNDSGFLTQHQDLSAYAKTANHYTKTESDNKYQLKGDYLTEHQSLTGYAKTVDHYTKTESDNKYQPKGNYLTEHQDLSHKADQKDLESHVNNSDIHMSEVDRLNINAFFYDVEQLQKRDVQPDILQNDMTHPAYIMNNPFEIKTMKGNTLSWNGDKTGKLVVEIDENSGWVLVSESEVLPTEEHVSKGVITESVVDGKTLTYTIDYFTQIFGDAYCSIEVKDSERTTIEAIEIVYDEGGAPDPRGQVVLPKKGIYFKYTADMYVSSVTFNHPDLSVFEGFNAVLPGEHLPEGVPYVVGGGLVELFPETELVSEGETFIFPSEVAFVDGELYGVIYNGGVYETKAVATEIEGISCTILGNFGSLTGDESTGEPFVLVYAPDAYSAQGFTGMVMPLDGSEEVTMSIVCDGKEVHKLPNECLDLDWIPKVNENEKVLFEEQTIVVDTSLSDMGGFRCYDLSIDLETRKKMVNEYDSLMVVIDGVKTKLSNVIRTEEDGIYFQAYFTTNGSAEAGTVVVGSGTANNAVILLPVGEYTVKVCHIEKSANKMPEEFLPDNVLTNEKVDSELSEESENPVQNKVVAAELGRLSEEIDDLKGNGTGGTITVDSELSKTSANPIQNKVVANKFDEVSKSIKHYITPEQFGAYGNNWTDDTAALQACLDYATSNQVSVVGYGKYKTSATLNIDAKFVDIYLDWIIYSGNDYAVNIATQYSTVRINQVIAGNGKGVKFGKSGVGCGYNKFEFTRVYTNGACLQLGNNDESIYESVFYNSFSTGWLNSKNENCIRVTNLSGGENSFDGNSSALDSPNDYAFYFKKGGTINVDKFALEHGCKSGFYVENTKVVAGYIRTRECMDTKRIDSGVTGLMLKLVGKAQFYSDFTHIDLTCIDTSELEHWFDDAGLLITDEESISYVKAGRYCNADYYHDSIYSDDIPGYIRMTGPYIYLDYEGRQVYHDFAESLDLRNWGILPPNVLDIHANGEIILNNAYCANGISVININQTYGYFVTIKDKNENVIFDGAEYGYGTYQLCCFISDASHVHHEWLYNPDFDTWKVVQTSKKEDAFELIETITVEEDGTTSIVRTEEPDSTPYKFKNIFVHGSVPTKSTGDATLAIYCGDGANSWASGIMINTFISKTFDNVRAWGTFLESNGWLIPLSSNGQNWSPATLFSSMSKPAPIHIIKRISIGASGTIFPIGTTFEIYAIRA